MSLLDFIRQLRADEADPKKARKGMLILGAVSIIGAFWNLFMFKIIPYMPFPEEEVPFKFPFELMYPIVITLFLTGILSLIAAQGIQQMKPWGRRLGQVGVSLFIGSIIIYGTWGMVSILPVEEFFEKQPLILIPFTFFVLIGVAQFAVPGYFGIRYLGRLPVSEDGFVQEPASFEELSHDIMAADAASPGQSYRHSPFPFGVTVTFIILFLPLFLIIMLTFVFAGPEYAPLAFIPAILILLLAPVIYNRLPSTFQKERRLIDSFTGGGSISLFNGSPPFFRLLLYEDGLEIRVMFQCYFIPYDKLDDLDQKIGFFSSGFLIKSDLPEVPSRIRYYGSFTGGAKKVLAAIKDHRDRYMTITGNDSEYRE